MYGCNANVANKRNQYNGNPGATTSRAKMACAPRKKKNTTRPYVLRAPGTPSKSAPQANPLPTFVAPIHLPHVYVCMYVCDVCM